MTFKILILLIIQISLLNSKDTFVNSNLKTAIANSTNGDRLFLNKGLYNEGEIVVDKSISIIGINYPEITGNKKTQVLVIKASNVTISGIEISNSGVSYVQDLAGIKLNKVQNCKIENCRINNCFFGIYLLKSTNCKLYNNAIKGSGGIESLNGNGIHNWYCSNIEILNNTITNHRDGLYFEFSSNCNIYNNTSFSNLRYGLHFMFSHSNHFESNLFKKNGSGIAVMYSHKVEMIKNTFEDNWGSASYGLLLKDISESKVINNTISNNTIGIYLEGGGKNRIEKNKIIRNGWAIKLMVSSENNVINNNHFSSNSFDISTNGNFNTSIFKNNFWDKYTGYDMNKDGIGDIPYHPVSLFSVVVEKNPSFLLLLNSFFVNLLDLAEHLLPSITPESFVDNQPLLKSNL